MSFETSNQPRLGVVVPLANESGTVDVFLERVLAALGDRDLVFCILDNVSKDDTQEKVESYGARDSRVICIWAPESLALLMPTFEVIGRRSTRGASGFWRWMGDSVMILRRFLCSLLQWSRGLSLLPEVALHQEVATVEIFIGPVSAGLVLSSLTGCFALR